MRSRRWPARLRRSSSLSSSKAKFSSHKPPNRAKVIRAGERPGPRASRRGKKGSGGKFLGPILIALLVVGVLVGVGYLSRYFTGNDATKPDTKQGDGQVKAPATGSQQPTTPPAQTQPPVTQQPATPPATQPPVDPNKAILDGRTRIDRSNGAAKTMKLTVYYADGLKNNMSLQPVEILVPQSTSQINDTVLQLINAPENLKLYSGIPAGTKVRSVNLNSQTGQATVDMSVELHNAQGSGTANNIISSFVYSLTEIPGVKSVQVWVLGRPAMIHGISWDKPYTRADLEGRNLFKVEPVVKYTAKP